MRTHLRRWACLLAGAVLCAPYPLVFLLWRALFDGPLFGVNGTVVMVSTDVLLAVVVGLSPVVRRMEIAVAAALLGGRPATKGDGGAWWRPQWRSGVWYLLHLFLGPITAALTVAVPFAVLTCLVAPFRDGIVVLPGWQSRAGWTGVLVLLTAVLIAVLAVALIMVCGAVLSHAAALLLGPSPAEKRADLEHQARTLAARNQMARELHDSIGHALTITTLQAGTARVLFDQDTGFARQALAAIEETGRVAMIELDHVIGLLREGPLAAATPTLADLEQLWQANRALGVVIDATITGPIQAVPGTISREMFRILQESLTNVIAHAGRTTVTVRLAATDHDVQLDVDNPLTISRQASRHGGGKGLPGMRERVQLLRGEMTAGPDSGHWRVRVQLPLPPAS